MVSNGFFIFYTSMKKGVPEMKFLKSVKVEMQEVTWPSKAKLSKDVVTVIQSTLLFAVFFAASDFIIDFIMKLFV